MHAIGSHPKMLPDLAYEHHVPSSKIVAMTAKVQTESAVHKSSIIKKWGLWTWTLFSLKIVLDISPYFPKPKFK